MHIIKLSAIDSTNSYLKNLISNSILEDNTVVVAERQFGGRGQMGTIWSSEEGKNLTISLLKCFESFKIQDQFYLSMAVALGVSSTIKEFVISNIRVKWPNDILADKDKIAGILIENILKGSEIKQVIIGIGLNLNQTEFEKDIGNATSMKKLTGQDYDKNEILESLVKHIGFYVEYVKQKRFEDLKKMYLKELYKFKEPVMFEIEKGEVFLGKICDVAPDGRLVIMLENEKTRKFNLKEIKFASL